MDQSDIRMGWAPALLCIEDEPAKTPKVVALKPHPKQKEFDDFAKGNHIGGCVAGDSLYGVIENFSVVKSPLLGEKSGLSMLQQEQNRIGRRMLESMGIYRGANDNKTATEVQQASSAMFPGGLLKRYKPNIDDTFGEGLKFYTNGEERSRWMAGDWDHLK